MKFKVVTFENLEKMKKTYIKAETKWLEPFDDEGLMGEVSSLDVNDDDDGEEIEDLGDALTKPRYSVWDED